VFPDSFIIEQLTANRDRCSQLPLIHETFWGKNVEFAVMLLF